ncbi:hypothetical protein [Salinimicrobium sp. HB62]|uniref:hypothetical protein n=1 Tax=Salinimicrobium sp. HB62 TaxID=3077781 RepID=UPI002D766B3C|nr:hypothetical protein [Salinimicrobium sp. HB62]
MKNLILHHLDTFIPAILLMAFWESIIPEISLTLLMVYALVYRTWLDGNRLHLKGLISKEDIWKIAYNGSRITYLKALYLQK